MTTTLTGQQVAEAGLDGWANLIGGLQTRIHTGDFATGLSVVAAIGAAAADQSSAHSPDLDLRRAHVDVRLSPITPDTVRFARAITALAADMSVRLDPAAVSRLELALDTPAQATVLSFWAAVTGMTPMPDEVRDPAGSLPTIWFQESGAEEPRQHWHPDVWVDPAQVRPRIDAALAAGGTLVSDEEAPSFWVLADPEGNKVCLCTWQSRH
jgi:4a-hydroxytetrahydrobiopterin dehydratase